MLTYCQISTQIRACRIIHGWRHTILCSTHTLSIVNNGGHKMWYCDWENREKHYDVDFEHFCAWIIKRLFDRLGWISGLMTHSCSCTILFISVTKSANDYFVLYTINYRLYALWTLKSILCVQLFYGPDETTNVPWPPIIQDWFRNNALNCLILSFPECSQSRLECIHVGNVRTELNREVIRQHGSEHPLPWVHRSRISWGHHSSFGQLPGNRREAKSLLIATTISV